MEKKTTKKSETTKTKEKTNVVKKEEKKAVLKEQVEKDERFEKKSIQLEWKIGLPWANTRGILNSPS